MQLRWVAGVVLSVTLGVVGCNSSSSSGSSTDQTVTPLAVAAITENDLDLSAVTLGQTEVAPLTRVELNNVPASVTEADLYIEYRLQSDAQVVVPENSSENGFAAVVREDGDGDDTPRYWLSAPLADPDGAELALRLTDGASYSRVLNLAVGALPQANPDITLNSVLDEVESLLQTVTEAYGLDYPADLQAMIDTPASVRAEYLPLIRAYHAIGNPDNTNGLRQKAFDDHTRQVMNRLLAHWSPETGLRQRTAFVQQNSDLIDEVVPLLAASAGTAPDLRSGSFGGTPGRNFEPTTRSTLADPLQDLMLPSPVEINSPNSLRYWMDRYGEMYRLQRDIQLGIDITEDVVMVIGAASMIASGPAGIQGATSVVALSQTADMAVSIAGYANDSFRMVRAFAPCCMIDIELELSPASGVVAQEDAASPAMLVTGVNAFVTSDAIDLAGELMSIAVDEVAGKVSEKLSERFKDSDLAEQAISNTLGSLYEGYDFVGKRTYFSWTVNLNGTDPERWVDLELDGLAGGPIVFKQLETRFNNFRFDLDETVFFGQEQAPTVLRAGPKEDVFDFGPWHPPIPVGSGEISGTAIQVTKSPNVIRIEEPGQQVEFTITVSNAADVSLNDSELFDLDSSLGVFNAVISGEDTGVYTYRYTAPEQEIDLPENFFVTLYAESRDGVRGRGADSPPERLTTMAVISSQPQLLIKPGGACLSVGNQQVFTAIDPDTSDHLPANWSVSGPAILVSSGVVEATGEGSVTVTATHPTDADRTDQVTLTTGDCTCWWNGRAEGDFGHNMTNDVLTIDFNDSGALTGLNLSNGVTGSMSFTLDPAIPAGATGTYSISESTGLDSTKTGRQMVWNNPAPIDPAQSNLPPISTLELTLTRHNMLDEGSTAGLVEPGARQLTGAISGTVVNDYLASTSPVEFNRLLGRLEARFQGDFWVDIASNRLNCSRGLGL
ncbi:hypothetical protein [Saccharospirillum impatiens]|uniref:hypothetical protein n=1 Tax=Saccharospirillum impatiens TaxID=169438 RepID=UPI00040A9BDA|nr:hypothetical protein [Saccharospirillum impatiens]